MRATLTTSKPAFIADVKFACKSPIVKTSGNQMYSIGSAKRFVSNKPLCNISSYCGTEKKKQEGLKKGFTKDGRKNIIAFGITDNPCDMIYNNLKAPSVKSTKCFGSGPPRFSDLSPNYRSTSTNSLKKVNLDAHLTHTRKVVPKISFPYTTKRIFADYQHKTAVPSPDTYYREDQNRRGGKGNSEYGLAYGAAKNSEHTSRHGVTINDQPARFDAFIDLKNSQRPGPSTYSTTNSKRKRPQTTSKMGKAIRMAPNRYDTVAPGAGSYRMQTEFGVYSVADTLNHLSVDKLSRISSSRSPRNRELGVRPHTQMMPHSARTLVRADNSAPATSQKKMRIKSGKTNFRKMSALKHINVRKPVNVREYSASAQKHAVKNVQDIYTASSPCLTQVKKQQSKTKRYHQLLQTSATMKKGFSIIESLLSNESTRLASEAALSTTQTTEQIRLQRGAPQKMASSGGFSNFISKTQRNMLFKQPSV